VAASVAIYKNDDVMVFAPVVGTREPNYPSLVSWTPSLRNARKSYLNKHMLSVPAY
jgi:hypothetical protein